MLKIVALYLCWAIILVSGGGSNPGHSAEIPSSSPGVTILGKEPTDSPVTTVVPNTSPTVPTTNTTVSPPTTTVKPTPPTTTSTTTVVPDTTTSTTLKPTTVPPTTTSAPPTTSPSPVTTTPVPAPKDGTWMVNGTNETCIVVRMNVQFNVSYTTADNKTMHKALTLPTEPSFTNVTGNCNATEQTLNITWHGGNDSFIIHFVKNNKTERYSMHHIELNLGSHEFPNATSNETLTFIHEADQFPTSLSNSYRCMRLQKLELTRNGTNGSAGIMEISDLQFQAFKSDKAAKFDAAQDCSPDVPDLVPIAVGCALTVLVIIILAAYLIGRRRSQARGYLSM